MIRLPFSLWKFITPPFLGGHLSFFRGGGGVHQMCGIRALQGRWMVRRLRRGRCGNRKMDLADGLNFTNFDYLLTLLGTITYPLPRHF